MTGIPRVVLLSGGLDSTVAFQIALEGAGPLVCLTARYGQRAEPREVEAASRMAAERGVRHEVIDLGWLGSITKTALCNAQAALPEPEGDEALDGAAARGSAAAVWVPNRNGVLLSAAAAFAETLLEGSGATHAEVVCGFNLEEAETFPDNSAAFVDAMNGALGFSTRGSVRVSAPTAHLRKPEIVTLGREIGAPLEHVWTCYRAGAEHCGACESCRRFERALTSAGALAWWEGRRAECTKTEALGAA
ncbi:MAG: 7-cyano-7-deazaguanine synthase QueC [Planctomycetota bacterium]|jgi:7-cyano-7-deazaguanine synthase